MTELLAWFNPTRWLILAVVIGGLALGVIGWKTHIESVAHAAGLKEGRAEVQGNWDKQTRELQAAALAEAKVNAAETARRLAQQKENDDAHAKELAAAHAAADRNARDAERVRVQSANAADLWSHTLRNSPTSADLAAAADAIRVLTDVRGRADQRASFLASYADSARAAGLKCERDYDALTLERAWPR